MHALKNNTTIRLSIAMVGLIILMASCDRSREDRGYEYFPDMSYGIDYKTWSENPAMKDGRTMQRPVDGTVPRHMQPYPFTANFEGRELAGQNLRNPLENHNGEYLAQGQDLFTIFCANCHGVAGDGRGWLHTSGKYVIPPTNLLEQRIRNLPEGEIYHVISAGWGVMGPHASLITPEQRWKIVAYVQNVLHERN
jgi:mono/diheme cytochrome c family protein